MAWPRGRVLPPLTALLLGLSGIPTAVAADPAGDGERLALEIGATKEKIGDYDDGGQVVALLSYTRKRGRFYGELLGGSLNGDRHNSVIFAGVGGWLEHKGAFARLSFGIGYASEVNVHVSSHNMFTESLSLGYKNFYLSYRHMSNGGFTLGNPSPNKGEDSYLIGYIHPL